MLIKNKLFNKPTVQDLDSYFIIYVKENSEVMNSTIANESVNPDSNITSDINESSSKYFKWNPADNIEKESTIQNSASTNENLSSNSSIISDNNPAYSENTLLKYCADFSLNGNTGILEKIIPSFLRNISTLISEKNGQLNTEWPALKNYILTIEA